MPGLALDTGKTHEASSPAAPLLLLILNKQFTKRWHDVARSGDDRSALPAALVDREASRVLQRANLRRLIRLISPTNLSRPNAADPCQDEGCNRGSSV